MDEDYFISGSLDAKVRIWSIPDRQLIDYTDLHEMVTAACYSPDGQVALYSSSYFSPATLFQLVPIHATVIIELVNQWCHFLP